jgi:D-cysteine desulfhydrase
MGEAVAREGRKAYVIPTGGSNAIGGLGYAACAQELLAQTFDLSLRFDCIFVASGSSGTHGGLLAGLWGLHADIPVVGIGVSREPADQEPLVHAEAVAVGELLGLRQPVPRELVRAVGGYWQPKYSVPNARMVEAVQLLARTEAIVLDPTYTGKAMAGLIGLVRDGTLRAGQNVLFLHTGGLPAVFADVPALLGEVPVAP